MNISSSINRAPPPTTDLAGLMAAGETLQVDLLDALRTDVSQATKRLKDAVDRLDLTVTLASKLLARPSPNSTVQQALLGKNSEEALQMLSLLRASGVSIDGPLKYPVIVVPTGADRGELKWLTFDQREALMNPPAEKNPQVITNLHINFAEWTPITPGLDILNEWGTAEPSTPITEVRTDTERTLFLDQEANLPVSRAQINSAIGTLVLSLLPQKAAVELAQSLLKNRASAIDDFATEFSKKNAEFRNTISEHAAEERIEDRAEEVRKREQQLRTLYPEITALNPRTREEPIDPSPKTYAKPPTSADAGNSNQES